MGVYERTAAVYRYIVRYKVENDGVSPSLRDLGDYIGVKSTSLVSYYLSLLEEAGLIVVDTRQARGIKLVGGQYIPPKGRAHVE